MSITVRGQKEASPWDMEQRWSLSFVLTLFLPIGVPESRHEGRLSGKGALGKKAKICMDGHSFTKAHHTIMQSSTLVATYIEVHKNIVRSNYPGQSDRLIRDEHIKTFGGWLQTHLMNDTTVGDQLYLLARSPSST